MGCEDTFEFIADPIGSLIGIQGPATLLTHPWDIGDAIASDWSVFKHLLVADMRKDRETQIQSATNARSIVYGRTRVGNTIAYAESSGAKNEYLNIMCIHAGHEIDGYEEIYFDDKLVMDAAGGWSRYAPYVDRAIVRGSDGTQTAASSFMVSASTGGWTSAHKLIGVAYTHVQLVYDEAVYPGGVPVVKAVLRGKRIFDPRNKKIAWSNNPALCILDYMLLPVSLGGMGCDLDEINMPSFITAANVCDEIVYSYVADAPGVRSVTQVVPGVSPTYPEKRYTLNGQIKLDGSPIAIIKSMLTSCAGDAVYSNGMWTLHAGSPVASVATIDESWLNGSISFQTGANKNDKINHAKGVFTNSNDYWSDCEFPPVPIGASTPPNATYWGLSAQPAQYASASTYAVGQYVALAGKIYLCYNAAPINTAPPNSSYWVLVEEYDAGLIYPVNYKVQRGGAVFTSLTTVPAANAYLAEDGGELLTANMTLPFTITSSEAQRLAKIDLEKSRRGLSVSYPCNHRAFPFDVMDVIKVNNTRLGWAEKEFRVVGWTFGHMSGTSLSLTEYDAAVYNWSPGDSTPLIAPILTNLPDPFTVATPVNLSVTESLYRGNTPGVIMTKAVFTWDASDAQSTLYDVFLDGIYQMTSRNNSVELTDVTPGQRTFAVRALNSIGTRSEFASISFFIYGKTAPPANVTNFYATPVITGGIRFAWSPVADLDVSEYLIRYSPLTSGADWFGSSEILRSNATYANLNVAQTGTYMIKAIDTTGHESSAADSVVISTVASNIGLTAHTLIVEQPAWAGGLYNMSEIADELRVGYGGPPPPEGTIITSVTGKYTAAAEIDFGEVKTARVSAQCTWRTDAMDTSFDLVDNIDGIYGWDGQTGKSDVQVYIYTSQDSSLPTFKQPLFAGDYSFQRAYFEVEAFDYLPDRLTISALAINVDLHDTTITI